MFGHFPRIARPIASGVRRARVRDEIFSQAPVTLQLTPKLPSLEGHPQDLFLETIIFQLQVVFTPRIPLVRNIDGYVFSDLRSTSQLNVCPSVRHAFIAK